MVPRAFLFTSAASPMDYVQRKGSNSPQNGSHFHIPNEAAPSIPVVIPPKRAPRKTPINREPDDGRRDNRRRSGSVSRSSSVNSLNREVPSSIAMLLEATAIPVPRRSWTKRNNRRLPPGNHVEGFSRLLWEGINRKEENLPLLDGSGNATLDILLTPPGYDHDHDHDNEKLMLASELESFSIHSLSMDSVPTLDNELESYSPYGPTTPASSPRSLVERRVKQLSPSEDCASDHPLLETDPSEYSNMLFVSPERSTSKPVGSSRTLPRFRSTFKSNLTASLRAIKFAAQTVSNFATPSIRQEDILKRSLFTISPELTDDKRPRPMNEPPSPALRRYLNPTTLSPVEMHIHHDYSPDSTHMPHHCPASIQMETYHYSGCGGRKGNPAGGDQRFYPYDPEIPPITRQREPRENSDFLRMVVLEMNMRRSGKLRDDIPIRAKIWLPPRKIGSTRMSTLRAYACPERWVGVSAGYT